MLVCFLAVILVSVLGCASFGGGKISGVNWALAKNGGKATAFSEESDHPASTLINGVTSSEGWNQGEGWQASFSAGSRGRSRRNRRSAEEGHWITIELAQPVSVNNVKIHTIDSEEYPAENFGVSDLLVQYEFETASKEMIWANADRYGKKVGEKDNIVRNNTNSVINVRFSPVNTQRLRVLIYRTNDLATISETNRAKQGVIRITEIEVFGMGRHKDKDELDVLFK